MSPVWVTDIKSALSASHVCANRSCRAEAASYDFVEASDLFLAV